MDVILLAPDAEQRTVSLPAFVDSGADGTIVPVRHRKGIDAPKVGITFIRSQWHERHRMVTYQIDIQIDTLTVRNIEVVGDAISDEIVLGRDVLNRLRVLLDGIAQTTEIRG